MIKHYCKIIVLLIVSFLSSLSYASDFEIPHQFNPGDILSADIMNEIFTTIRTTEKSVSEIDLVGTWSCESTMGASNSGVPGIADGWAVDEENLIMVLSNSTLVFQNDGDETYSLTTTAPNPFVPTFEQAVTSPYKIRAEYIYFSYNSNPPAAIEPYRAQLTGTSRLILSTTNYTSFASLICDKQNLPPSSPTELAGSLSGSTVTLTWTDNSSDETGFTILRKDSLTGDYNEIATASANATSTTNTLTSNGTYWFRVLATNANGSSVGSNVVKVIKE